MMPRVRDTRAFFPFTERQVIEDLSCVEPASVGWPVTHWSQQSLAAAAGELEYLEYVDSIHQTTVGDILHEADLQLHRFRYWKTTVRDDEAVARALKILWYYERIDGCGDAARCSSVRTSSLISKSWNERDLSNGCAPVRSSVRRSSTSTSGMAP